MPIADVPLRSAAAPGLAGHHGRVDDADVRRLQLLGDVRLLVAREQAVQHLQGRVQLALARVVLAAARARARSPPPWPASRASATARLLRGRGLVVVLRRADDALRLGPRASRPRLLDLVSILMTSGCCSRYCSSSWACLRSRLAELDAQLWTMGLRMTSGSSSGLRRRASGRTAPPSRRRSVLRSLSAVPSSLSFWSSSVRRSSMLTMPSRSLSFPASGSALLDLLALLVDLRAQPLRPPRTRSGSGTRASAGCRSARACWRSARPARDGRPRR